ncbi:uncharacterized protein LOC135345996 [Halichondria panicea]|uniref:uncharacterized protein LOC135345996 n=1 Tax=Halichondria panicea TaxID=6063 RepID=UPI00312BA21C
MAKKRPREVTDFDAIGDELIPSATVRCVLTSLSPIKKGRKCKYFDGSATDGKTRRRLLSFSESQLELLQKFKRAKETVELRDCQVKRGIRGDQMEIVLKSNTEIARCSKQLDSSNIDFDDGVVPEVPVSAFEGKCVYDVVSVRAKVHTVYEREILDDGKVKQDICISDASGAGRVTVWGSHVGTMAVGDSYLLSGFIVKEFRGNKYLSMRKEGSNIEKIDDVGAVMNVDETNVNIGGSIRNARIVCVMEFVSRKVCIVCYSYVEPGPGSPPVHGRCLTCNVAQRYDCCSSSLFAKLMFKVDGGECVTLNANAYILRSLLGISEKDVADELSILSVPKFESVSFNGQDTMTDFKFESETEEAEVKQKTSV